jgi:hypothetical protein
MAATRFLAKCMVAVPKLSACGDLPSAPRASAAPSPRPCARNLQASPAQAEAMARSQGANIIGLQYGGTGPLVSVLVSKAGGRYRLQSDCFQAMWLVMQVGPVKGHGCHYMRQQSAGVPSAMLPHVVTAACSGKRAALQRSMAVFESI